MRAPTMPAAPAARGVRRRRRDTGVRRDDGTRCRRRAAAPRGCGSGGCSRRARRAPGRHPVRRAPRHARRTPTRGRRCVPSRAAKIAGELYQLEGSDGSSPPQRGTRLRAHRTPSRSRAPGGRAAGSLGGSAAHRAGRTSAPRIGVEFARIAVAAVDRVHDRPGGQRVADAGHRADAGALAGPRRGRSGSGTAQSVAKRAPTITSERHGRRVSALVNWLREGHLAWRRTRPRARGCAVRCRRPPARGGSAAARCS